MSWWLFESGKLDRGIFLIHLREISGLIHCQTWYVQTNSFFHYRTYIAQGRSSGQYILRETMRVASQLQECGWIIRLNWLPGHEGIYGNECADALAREAANSPAPHVAEELTLMAST